MFKIQGVEYVKFICYIDIITLLSITVLRVGRLQREVGEEWKLRAT